PMKRAPPPLLSGFGAERLTITNPVVEPVALDRPDALLPDPSPVGVRGPSSKLFGAVVARCDQGRLDLRLAAAIELGADRLRSLPPRLDHRSVGAASSKLVLERADPLAGRDGLLLPAGEAPALVGELRALLGAAPPAPLGLQALDPSLDRRDEVARSGRLLARGVELVPPPHLLPRRRLERPELGAELGVRAGGERALCLGAGFLEDGRALVLASGGKRRRVEVVAG